MLQTLAATLLVIWLLLWAIFHLAGGPIHLLVVAAILILVYRIATQSNMKGV